MFIFSLVKDSIKYYFIPIHLRALFIGVFFPLIVFIPNYDIRNMARNFMIDFYSYITIDVYFKRVRLNHQHNYSINFCH